MTETDLKWPGPARGTKGGPIEADQCLQNVRANRHTWPLQMISHSAANQLTTDIFMRFSYQETTSLIELWWRKFLFSRSRGGKSDPSEFKMAVLVGRQLLLLVSVGCTQFCMSFAWNQLGFFFFWTKDVSMTVRALEARTACLWYSVCFLACVWFCV